MITFINHIQNSSRKSYSRTKINNSFLNRKFTFSSQFKSYFATFTNRTREIKTNV